MLKKRFSINISYALIICLLFLAAMNFVAKFYYFAFATTMLLLVVMRKIRINAISLVYLALGLLMATYHIRQGVLAALRPLSYFGVYVVGFNLPRSSSAQRGGKEEQDVAYQLLLTVALGSFVHMMLNFFLSRGQNLGRNTLDIWTGDLMSATGQAALGSVMISMACAMILVPNKQYSRLLGWVAILSIMLYNLTLAGRTLVFLLCICLAAGGWFVLSKADSFNKKRWKMLSRVASAAAILIVIYVMNIGGVRELVEGSNLYDRFFGSAEIGVTETGRWTSKLYFLRNLLEYPFGGLHMRAQVSYAHDLLLDAYDEYGIFSLPLLLTVLADGVIQLYRFCKKDCHMLSYRVAALCVGLAILVMFFVEPIFAGMPWLFVCYSLTNGALNCANRAATQNNVQG